MRYESPYATLAQILMSRHVGLTHTRLAGEIVVARARLNEWLYKTGKAALSIDEWAEMVERVLAIEERYKDAWEALESQPTDKTKGQELPNLEIALVCAAAELRLVREELVERFGDNAG